MWNVFLTYVGFVLGKNWEKIKQYSDYVSFGVLVILIVLIVYFIWRHIKKK